ncbi:MAG: hypothetical protein ACTHQ3_12735 [Motilibacteraceae bacterium]
MTTLPRSSDDPRVLEWERRVLAGIDDIPAYGSPQWCELPAGDPRRMAGIVRAAAAWREHRSPAAVAQDELERANEVRRLADQLVAERIRRATRDVREAADWAALLRDARPHAEVAAIRQAAHEKAAARGDTRPHVPTRDRRRAA